MGGAPLLLLGICLSLQAAPRQEAVFVPGERFTLAWTHSIERQRWEEDYAITPSPQPGTAILHAVAARVRGSAAGMEPPPDARLIDGWYHYTPAERRPVVLRLSRSAFVPDYERCDQAQGCRPLSHWLPSDGGVTELTACVRPAPSPTR
ncbi:MAG: DUF1850 domain-containing protein [Burkholderiales bacterium]|nr:MAG: DUF1850 domain-containing protein [Burkholderiales bacterium]